MFTSRAQPGAISLTLATFTNSPMQGDVQLLSGVNAEAAVSCCRGKQCELRVAHMNQCLMIATLQVNLGLMLDAVVDHRIEPIAFASWRNRTWHAVVE